MSALANGLDQAPPAAVAVTEEYLRCDFCRRGRDQVVRLIVRGHAAICSECLGDALAILRAEVSRPARHAAFSPPKPAEIMPKIIPGSANGHAPPLTSRDGFTGEMCPMPDCGSLRMVRTGTCSICLDCYTSGGCG
jgi:hypothetical protein